jgi:hypothetical protein
MATVGYDGEFFVADNTGKIIPVCGIVGGNKEEHIILEEREEGQVIEKWEMHEDNVTLEINSPVFSDELSQHNWISHLRLRLNKSLDKTNLGIHAAATDLQGVVKFPMDVLKKCGPQALEIGCDPDFDAYAKNPEQSREVPKTGFKRGQRYAGFHIHLGYSTCKDIPPHYVVQMLDMIAVMMCQPEKERLNVYGPGTFRPKPYGVEYRGLSTRQMLSPTGAEWINRFHSYAFQLARALETHAPIMAEIYSKYDIPGLMAEFKMGKGSNIHHQADNFIEDLGFMGVAFGPPLHYRELRDKWKGMDFIEGEKKDKKERDTFRKKFGLEALIRDPIPQPLDAGQDAMALMEQARRRVLEMEAAVDVAAVAERIWENLDKLLCLLW